MTSFLLFDYYLNSYTEYLHINLCVDKNSISLGKNMRVVSNLHIATVTNPIISLNAFFDDSSRFSTKKRKTIMLESLLLPYKDLEFFLRLTGLARIVYTTSNRSGWSGHTWFALELRGKAFYHIGK